MARTVGVVLGLSFLFTFGIFSCSIVSCDIRQKVGTFLVEETAGVFTTNLPMSKFCRTTDNLFAYLTITMSVL